MHTTVCMSEKLTQSLTMGVNQTLRLLIITFGIYTRCQKMKVKFMCRKFECDQFRKMQLQGLPDVITLVVS